MPSRSSKRTLGTVPQPEQGFILPMVLGVGVVMILLGVMMIERSSQNRVAAIALKANARSTAAAEHGVTQLQSLLNRYPPLATACSDGNLSGTCGSSPSWKTLKNKVLEPCSTDESQPISWLQPYANQDWKNSTADPADGQFRLVSYTYQPNTTPTNIIGTGTLVVDGQINPDDAVRTATTQLRVNFNITRDPGLNTPPGLWIQDNQTSNAATTVDLLTNVRDSTCPSTENAASSAQQIRSQIQPPNLFQPTPGLAFPDLPPEGTTPTTANLMDAIEHPTNALLSPASPPSGTVLTYRIKAKNGQSINLTDSSDALKIDAGANTVVLDLEGGLNLTNGSKIQVGDNTTLIVYVHGPLTLEGNNTNAAIEQEGTPAATRVQIYVYSPPPPATPSDPTPPSYSITLKGKEKPLYLVLFAPNAQVTSAAKVQGAIWAKSWQGQESAAIAQSPINLSDLKLVWPSHISPITAWQVNPP